MRRAAGPIALLLALAQAAGSAETALAPDQSYARTAAAAFHTAVRPPYIVYTVDRRDTIDGVPDFSNTYSARIWCRTADGSALARRISRGRAYGELEHEFVRFDDRIDPGPPTADLFEPARARDAHGVPLAGATATPAPPAEIGRVVVHYEDYRVVAAEHDGTLVHVTLEPRRDPDRNRVRDVWLDPFGSVTRLVLADHLYTPDAAIPERFDVRLTVRAGVPIVTSIHGETRYDRYANPHALLHTVDYRFRDLRFPDSLPDWYFDGHSYGAHRAEAPEE